MEVWLNSILNEMHKTHRFLIKKAIFNYAKGIERTRIEWMQENVGMVCLAANSVWFTAEMEETFRQIANGQRDAMKAFLKQHNTQIDDLIAKGLKIN